MFCWVFFVVFCLQATRPDMIRILSAALHVVLRRDMSLNRRLYAWLLGEKQTQDTHSYLCDKLVKEQYNIAMVMRTKYSFACYQSLL